MFHDMNKEVYWILFCDKTVFFNFTLIVRDVYFLFLKFDNFIKGIVYIYNL